MPSVHQGRSDCAQRSPDSLFGIVGRLRRGFDLASALLTADKRSARGSDGERADKNSPSQIRGRRAPAIVLVPRWRGPRARKATVTLIRVGYVHSFVDFQNSEKGFLRNVDAADLFHALLAFLLFLEQLAFARDIAA